MIEQPDPGALHQLDEILFIDFIESGFEVVSKTFQLQLSFNRFALLKTCVHVGVILAKKTYWLASLAQPTFELITRQMMMFDWL